MTIPNQPGTSGALRLNHLNLCVSDVPALCDIFARHFGFRIAQRSTEAAILYGSDGFFLVLMKIGADSSRTYPSNTPFNFHVGFVLDEAVQVHAKHRELQEAGLSLNPIASFEAMGARWTSFFCHVGDGIAIEVTHRELTVGETSSLKTA